MRSIFAELTPTATDYLVSAIKHQIDNGDVHNKATRLSVDDDYKVDPPVGYSYSYSRERYVKKRKVFSPRKQSMRIKTSYHRAACPSAAPDNLNLAHGADDECLTDILYNCEQKLWLETKICVEASSQFHPFESCSKWGGKGESK